MRFLLCLLLAGCASSGEYAQCTLPVVRDAGMGVMVDGCAHWLFSPSKEQTARFERKQ